MLDLAPVDTVPTYMIIRIYMQDPQPKGKVLTLFCRSNIRCKTECSSKSPVTGNFPSRNPPNQTKAVRAKVQGHGHTPQTLRQGSNLTPNPSPCPHAVTYWATLTHDISCAPWPILHVKPLHAIMLC